jgi:hypothetical protein
MAEPDDAVTASGLDGQAGIGLPDAPGPGDRVDAPAAGKEAELSSDGLDGFRSAMADATDEDASAVGTGTDPAVDTETEPVVDEGTDPVADDGTGTGDSSSGSDDASVTDQPDWPDPDSIRITPDRATHILDGDDTGGGHRAGTGNPGKTEFPADWDDDKILGNIENVARNPDVKPDEPQPKGQWLYEGSRDGVHTYVVVNPDGTVRTAWPREGDPGVVRNPKKG